MPTATLDDEYTDTEYSLGDEVEAALQRDNEACQAMSEALNQNAICMRLTIRQPGKWKKGSVDKVETDAEKKSLGLRKQLLKSEKYDRLFEITRALRSYIEKRSLPSFFQTGVYLLPVTLIQDVEQQIATTKNKLREALQEFLAEYPELVEAAKERLKSQFNPRDYPTAQRLARKFSIEHDYIQFAATPEALKDFDAEAFLKQEQKFEGLWQEVAQNTRMALREELRNLTQRLAERLTPDEDGKPKVFKSSIVEGLQEFLDLVTARNITNDEQLEELAAKSRQLLKGVGVEDLRDTGSSTREVVRDGLNKVLEQLDQPGFIQKIERVYMLDDED